MFQRLIRVHQLHFVPTKYLGQNFIHLKKSQMFANAYMRSTSKLRIICIRTDHILRNFHSRMNVIYTTLWMLGAGEYHTWNMHLSILFSCWRSASSHLWGLKEPGAGPKTTSSRWTTHALTATLTPPGKCIPFTVDPVLGTVRVMLNASAGFNRIVSLRHAWK